jgi:BTB/POZ domain-containing protein KCTD9
MLNKSELKLNLIYKASRDGFKSTDFHSKCDFKGPTISLIQSEHGKTFGGYTNLNWSPKQGWIKGHCKSFIFQLDYNTKHQSYKNQFELFQHFNYSIRFGTNDISIPSDSDKNLKSSCNLG